MSSFPLIQEIQNPKEVAPKTNIRYKEYTIQLDDNSFQGIGIPLRECAAFEETVSADENLTRSEVKALLRKHRGITIEK